MESSATSLRGRVISGYGKGAGKANDGIDIQVPEGTPVKAAEKAPGPTATEMATVPAVSERSVKNGPKLSLERTLAPSVGSNTTLAPGVTGTTEMSRATRNVFDSSGSAEPKVVTPGEGAAPPSDAIVLFDGKDLSQWIGKTKMLLLTFHSKVPCQ